MRANGYTATETKREYELRTVEGQAEPVRVLVKETVHEKHVAPDVAAAFIWLKNRRQNDWRDRREIVGDPDNPLTPEQTNLERARRLVFLLRQAENRLMDDNESEVTH